MSDFMVQVSAGTGPIEVRRFVVQLAAWLERLLRERGLVVAPAVERTLTAAPRSLALACAGEPSRAADLVGTHALVHAARGKRARQRWFAAVTLHAAPAPTATRVDDGDIAWSAARAGGPGGQRVNKVASAVRAVHRPSGIAVRAAGERSQRANRQAARAQIAAQLRERAAAERAAADARSRIAHYRVQRGGAIRTYRLVDGELRLED